MREIVPARRLVVEAVMKDPYVVDEYEKDCRAFHTLAVYVFGMVVEELMYVLTAASV